MCEYRLVRVKWIDATTDSGWIDIDTAKNYKPIQCETVGYLLKDDEKYIVVASTVSGDQCNGIISIPKKWIKLCD